MAETATKRRRPEGITVRHGCGCAAGEGGRCACRPAYQAQVFSPRDRRTTRKSFQSLSEARAWRSDTQAALRHGAVRAPTRTTLEEAADDWLCAARAGIARIRSGDPYKGHSSITITLDRYGHLMPGSEAEAAGMVEAYLEREAAG